MADQEEFIEQDEIVEEQVLDDQDNEPIPMDDDDDNAEVEDEVNINETNNEEMVELVDDSVQGFFGHKDSVYAVDIHPIDQNIIVSGGGDEKSFLWRSDTGEQICELSGHVDTVQTVLFSKDGQYVASGGMDGKVFVWKVDSRELIASLEGPDEIVWLDWHPKGTILLAGANDATIWMWQIPSGNCMNVFSGHAGPVTAGQFTPDGKKIVTGSEDSSLMLWDPKTASTTLKISREDARFHREGITSLAINKESALVLTGSTDGSAILVNLSNGAILGSFENHTESVETVGFCNVLPLSATGSVDNKLNIWDVNTMRLRQTCHHEDAIIKLQWHLDSPLLTTCSADRTVRLWDGRTGNNEKTWHGHQDSILGFSLSKYESKIRVIFMELVFRISLRIIY
ncbi:18588_t:CDS:10 [Gigaspora margarita]|uniref:18588_t:CDS:1 n=1 Tax=Gigaspora margarita TaxID=4874 RepID=A0ABN7UAJ0_GIGMA|nr:18588_t:CDS:10 [Gigaspora margarita]